MRIALVVVDLQRAFFSATRQGQPALPSVVEYVAHAVGLFRRAGAPVVWVHDIESCAPGSAGYALVEGLVAEPGDGRLDKTRGDAFAEGGLAAVLARHDCTGVLLCGFSAEGCVLATLHGAQARGLPVYLLRDAVLSHRPGAAQFVEGMVPLVSHEAIDALLAGHALPARPPSDAALALDIAPVGPDDFIAFVDHLERCAAENGRDGDVVFMPYGADRPFERAPFQKRLEKQVGQPFDAEVWEQGWLVRDGSSAACAHINLHARGRGPARHVATLGMGIERCWRRRGLGTRLLRHALDWARAQPEIGWVDLLVFAENHPARALYAREGFIELGTTADLVRIDGRPIDDVHMVRWVGE